ncbi:MAG: hypothetical protein ACK4WH_04710 [Phycisphaerales bacterium]
MSTVFASGAAWQPENRPGSGRPPEGRPEGPGRGPGGARGAGSVEAGMRGMNRALKQLKGQVSDTAKKDENLRLIGDLQRSAIVAKSSPLPDSILKGAKDEGEKAKLSLDFRKRMIQIVRLALDTEEDIVAGKGAEAGKKLDQISVLQEEGHKALGVKDED